MGEGGEIRPFAAFNEHCTFRKSMNQQMTELISA